MKYLKSYENNQKFKINDIVVIYKCNFNVYSDEFTHYIKNTAGIITSSSEGITSKIYYDVKFFNVPNKFHIYFLDKEHKLFVNNTEIRYATIKEKEDLEQIITANKYNI